MPGDASISMCARVGTAIFSLSRLAQELDAHADVLAELQLLQDGLRARLQSPAPPGDASQAALAPVDHAQRRAREILQELSEAPRAIVQGACRDAARIADLRHTIGGRREQSLRQMGGILWSLSQTLDHAAQSGEAVLLSRLTFAGMLRPGSAWRADIERRIETPLREELHEHFDNVLVLTEADQRGAWEVLETERRALFASNGTASPPPFASTRAQLRDELDAVVAAHPPGEPFTRQMDTHFLRAAISLRAALFAIAGCAVLFLFSLATTPATVRTVLGGTAIVASLTLLATILWRRRLLGEYRSLMAVRRGELIAGLEEHLRAGIYHFAQDITDSLGTLQVATIARRKTHEPLLARARQLDGIFAKCAAETGQDERRAV